MGILILIIVVGVVIWLIKKGMEQAALNRSAREAFNAKHAGWDIYIAPFDQAVIAINHDACAIVLGTTTKHNEYPWSSIASVDVIRDGASIVSTNRGSQLTGAAVGGVLLGPLGLLIGGVTGSKRTVQRVGQIAIKIIVDDRFTPIYTINFLRVPGGGADPQNRHVQEAAKRAEHIHALILNAIRNSSHQPVRTPEISQRSVGDRIDPLWKLREAGALTQSEFDQQKAKLLGGLSNPAQGVE